jgi:hypothetical protein
MLLSPLEPPTLAPRLAWSEEVAVSSSSGTIIIGSRRRREEKEKEEREKEERKKSLYVLPFVCPEVVFSPGKVSPVYCERVQVRKTPGQRKIFIHA